MDLTVFTSNLGVSLVDLICIVLIFMSILAAIVDIRIAIMFFTVVSLSYFVVLYELGDPNFYKPLMLMMSSIVLLLLTILISHSKSGRFDLT